MGRGGGSSRPEIFREISSCGKETGNGLSLQGSPGFNILDTLGLPASMWSTRGVAFPLEEEMGVYQVSPSSTCVRLLPSIGSLGNRVDFVPESSEVGQNRALFKCTIMSFWT